MELVTESSCGCFVPNGCAWNCSIIEGFYYYLLQDLCRQVYFENKTASQDVCRAAAARMTMEQYNTFWYGWLVINLQYMIDKGSIFSSIVW